MEGLEDLNYCIKRFFPMGYGYLYIWLWIWGQVVHGLHHRSG